MGNNPSTPAKSERAGSQPHSPGYGSVLHRREHNNEASQPVRQVPRRRESLQALSSAKATAAPPSTSTVVASSQSASTPTSQARSIPGTQSGHSRSRSSTTTTPRSTGNDVSAISPRSTMGAEQSRSSPRPPSRRQSLKSPTPPPEPRLSPASRPVDVPMSAAASHGRSFQPSPLDPLAPPSEAFHLPPSSFSRPPRLPLPIEEEVHTPGSPIISPADITSPSPVDGTEPEDILPRRSSVVSSNLDDDDDRDGFEAYPTDTAGPKVPTVIEWRNCAHTDKIYVTGTFTNWERKFRLHKDGPSKHKGALSALLQLPPGTHHIKFIMNGDMMTSEDLPTTVDYTNILVNYVEVSLDDLPTAENPNPAPVVPAPAPAAIAEPPAPSRPLDIRPRPGAADTDPSHHHPRDTLPDQAVFEEIPEPTETTEPAEAAETASPTPTPAPETPAEEQADQPAKVEKPRTPSKPPIQRRPSKEYTSDIPAYLLDLDTWIPPSKDKDPTPAHQAARYRFERASAAAESQPAPPSLPMFLSKSILNGTTPMKDDSSVLIMPNHTVLNHLATTNIKQGVLATSATTRYKRKFLTTIMYKPRSDDGD